MEKNNRANMKPFVWVTALVVSGIFLAGAIFTGVDVLSDGDILTNPEFKVATGWLVVGLMFLSLGLRGWRAHRRSIRAENQRGTARTSS